MISKIIDFNILYFSKRTFMKKQLIMFSFMLAMVNFNTTHAEVNALSFYDETEEKAKWNFVEAAFITNIASQKQTFWKHAFAAVPGIIGSVAAYKSCEFNDLLPFKTAKDTKNDWLFGANNNPAVAYSIITIACGSVITYNALQCHIAHQANRCALQDFFSNYEDNQLFVPAALQHAFDLIEERIVLEGINAVLADADEYVDIITNIIMRNFESRYKSVLDAKSRDALADTKTVIENFKNLFDGTSKIK